MRNFMGQNPLTMMSELAERNLAIWRSMNERLYQQQHDKLQHKEADSNALEEAQDKGAQENERNP
jgi:hypothetical protein